MDIGTGIAIAGVWLFAASTALSKTVTGTGMWIAMVIAGVVTYFLAG